MQRSLWPHISISHFDSWIVSRSAPKFSILFEDVFDQNFHGRERKSRPYRGKPLSPWVGENNFDGGPIEKEKGMGGFFGREPFCGR